MSKFNFHTHEGTQKLYRKQFQQIIKRYGVPCVYVHKQEGSPDKLYGEDAAISYKSTSKLKLFLETMEYYDGLGQTFTNFLTVLDDRMRFKVEIESFTKSTGKDFPEEGDLVAFELSGPEYALQKINPNNKTYEIFEIKGVEKRSDFYALGTFFSYVLECKKFEYNHERFNTNIPLIDALNEITDKKQVNESIGDNAVIDELNINGIEAFNPITGEIEDSKQPVTESDPCDPFKPTENKLTTNWDQSDPYNNGE